MVWSLKCDCNERMEIEINSFKEFEEVKLFSINK